MPERIVIDASVWVSHLRPQDVHHDASHSCLQLRAGDAIYVALAHTLGLPLVSWDKEQLQKASTLITTYTPENYIFPNTDDNSDEEAT